MPQKKHSREATILKARSAIIQSRSDYLQARSAYYAPKAPVVGAEGAWCREKTQSRSDYCRREAPTTRRRRLLLAPKAPDMRRRRLGNFIGALIRGLPWRRRRPTLRSGAASFNITMSNIVVHQFDFDLPFFYDIRGNIIICTANWSNVRSLSTLFATYNIHVRRLLLCAFQTVDTIIELN